jgi:hypothetical protein
MSISFRPFSTALLGLLAAGIADGQSVDLKLLAGQLNDASGTAAPNDSLVLLVANTSGTDNGTASTFGTLAGGSGLALGDYLNSTTEIVGIGAIDTSNGPGEVSLDTGNFTLNAAPLTNLAIGDLLAAVWVPTLDESSNVLPSGASYGLFTAGDAPLDGSAVWRIPDSGDAQLIFATNSAGGAYDNSAGNASMMASTSAVPEPSDWSLILGTAALGVAAARRRWVKLERSGR